MTHNAPFFAEGGIPWVIPTVAVLYISQVQTLVQLDFCFGPEFVGSAATNQRFR